MTSQELLDTFKALGLVLLFGVVVITFLLVTK